MVARQQRQYLTKVYLALSWLLLYGRTMIEKPLHRQLRRMCWLSGTNPEASPRSDAYAFVEARLV